MYFYKWWARALNSNKTGDDNYLNALWQSINLIQEKLKTSIYDWNKYWKGFAVIVLNSVCSIWIEYIHTYVHVISNTEEKINKIQQWSIFWKASINWKIQSCLHLVFNENNDTDTWQLRVWTRSCDISNCCLFKFLTYHCITLPSSSWHMLSKFVRNFSVFRNFIWASQINKFENIIENPFTFVTSIPIL